MEIEPSDAEWWRRHLARCAGGPEGLLDGIPSMPSEDLQRSTTSHAGEAALREAFDFYRDCRRVFDANGRLSRGDASLLDFGVGWGRIARFFLREVPPSRLFGIDVDPDLIAVCRTAFASENFTVCAPMPPTELGPQSFDFVVGYSVFSHLSEDACSRWMREFSRVLKPNGMLALTTRGRFFFDYCESLEPAEDDQYGRSLTRMFDDFALAKARYDAGELVHSSKHGVAGSGPRGGGFYGETFIPERYAATAWNDSLELIEFSGASDPPRHPIMFFRKPRA